MKPANWETVKETFSAMIDLPENERELFLADYDLEIREEVENLLAAHFEADDFIAAPFFSEKGIAEDETKDNFIGKQIENYLILEKIGVGGMGLVYLAERVNSDFKQKVALKIIKRGMDSEAILKRFATERRILSTLKHPNIAQLLDGGISSDGLPFFVMEYVDGKPLNQFCKESNLSLESRLEVFRQICAAVENAHQNLVIHRDLKPTNVIVTIDGNAKLLDFGIAKLLSDDGFENTNTAMRGKIFTPEYASPEQILGKTVTTATDVYSLGVILYELLAEHRPFETQGKSFEEIVKRICETEPPRPSKTGENQNLTAENEAKTLQIPKYQLRGDLDNIILKALRKEPSERYGSVQQFSEDVSRFLRGLPVLARPQTVKYLFGKYVKRHRAGVVATALVLLSMIGGISVATWQAIIARKERDKSNVRFQKLRETAKLLMYETRDSLESVPGSIKIRKSLSDKSVDLLDSLYDESTTDTEFLKELADAYEKLGKTELWHFREFERATKADEKAVEIRRKIISLEPNNVQRKVELYNSISTLNEAVEGKGDNGNALKNMREVQSIIREIAETDPTATNLTNLANHLVGSAAQYKNFGLLAEREKYLKEGNSILQKMIDEATGKNLAPPEKASLAWNLMWQGGSYRDLDDDEKALKCFQQAAELAESAYRADNSLQDAFNHASSSHRDLGELYEKRGDYQKALEMYRFSFEWLKTRENDESQNKQNLMFGIFFYANRCALMFQKLDRQKEADEIIEKPFKAYSAFIDAEKNAESLVTTPESLRDLAKYYATTNRIEKAAEIWQQYYDRVQKFLNKNSEDIGFMNSQVHAQNQIAEIYSAYDEKSDSFKTNDKARLVKAKFHYQKSVEIYRKSQTLYAPTQAEKDSLIKIEEKISQLENNKFAIMSHQDNAKSR